MLFDLDLLSLFRGKNAKSLPWWIEVKTNQPPCTYYFGPYSNPREATDQKQGFLEDLRGENAVGIKARLKRTQPEQLTIVPNESSR